jgi:hypothetical protein
MCTTGCLITSTPQFKPQQHTAPFLVDSTAEATPPGWPVGMVVTVDSANLGPITFSADVISQDDQIDPTMQSSFTSVTAHLYIDYGFTEIESGYPYRLQFAMMGSIPPDFIDRTTGRKKASVTWFTGDDISKPLPLGCHTATLVASHIFDISDGCPACVDDYTMITWPVLRCDSTMQGNCDSLPLSGMEACAGQLNPGTGNTFEQYRAKNPSPQCPETADGGAP